MTIDLTTKHAFCEASVHWQTWKMPSYGLARIEKYTHIRGMSSSGTFIAHQNVTGFNLKHFEVIEEHIKVSCSNCAHRLLCLLNPESKVVYSAIATERIASHR